MMRGYFERQVGRRKVAIYLYDEEAGKAVTLTFAEHTVQDQDPMPGTELPAGPQDDRTGLLQALAEALQKAGYMPPAPGVDAAKAELEATKLHLRDMRRVVDFIAPSALREPTQPYTMGIEEKD